MHGTHSLMFPSTTLGGRSSSVSPPYDALWPIGSPHLEHWDDLYNYNYPFWEYCYEYISDDDGGAPTIIEISDSIIVRIFFLTQIEIVFF